MLATVPAALVAFTLRKYVKATFEMPLVVACGWTVTAGLLWFGQRLGTRERSLDDITLADALKIGCFQALSPLFRGVSRSGSTIAGGLLTGLSHDAAASFSFLIAIPVIAGAALVKGRRSSNCCSCGWAFFPPPAVLEQQSVDLVGGYSPLVLAIVRSSRFWWDWFRCGGCCGSLHSRGLNGFVYYCLIAAPLTFAWQGYEAVYPNPSRSSKVESAQWRSLREF